MTETPEKKSDSRIALVLNSCVRRLSAVLVRLPRTGSCVLSILRPVSRLPIASSLWWRLRLYMTEAARRTQNPLRWVRIPGLRESLLVNIGSQFSCLYFDKTSYEGPTSEFLMKNLGPGDVLLDIGANCGYFTVLAAARVGGSGRVLSFEPNPIEMSHLEASLGRNGLEDRVTRSSVALSDSDGDDIEFFVGTSSADSAVSSLDPWSGHLESGSLSRDHTIKVKMRKLDSMLDELGIDRISMVKIDVEGVEMQVLRGMEETLKKLRPRHIICETGEEGQVTEFLRERGWKASPLQYHSEADKWGNMVFSRES